MAGVGLRVEIPALDLESATNKLVSKSKEVFREASQKWLTAVLVKIPVRTGFLAGAFTPMERAIGVAGKSTLGRIVSSLRTAFSGSSLQRGLRKRAYIKNEYYYDGGGKTLKTPTAGIKFATDSSSIFTFIGGKMSVNFEINITYLDINDRYRAIPSAPWNALAAGNSAFQSYLRDNVPRMLDINDYLTTQRITFN